MWIRRTPLLSLLVVITGVACATSGETNTPTPAGPAAVVAPQSKAEPPVALPNTDGTLKFAVLGDFGTATKQQYQLAQQMDTLQQKFGYELVILVGDNLYGSERPQDFEQKFEIPYNPLLDRKLKFYASLGNHDDRNQRLDQPLNMEAKLYYSVKGSKLSVYFFVLEITYPDPEQIKWAVGELKG